MPIHQKRDEHQKQEKQGIFETRHCSIVSF